MNAKRIFQVYRETIVKPPKSSTLGPASSADLGAWRWRLIAARNGRIVASSGESFDSRGNALRAARREASFYQPGAATVEVLNAE